MAFFAGTAGNDDIDGTVGTDLFSLSQGGDDDAFGDAGDDVFRMGAAFGAADSIDGGADRDTVVLKGDYSSLLTFSATTIIDVEKLVLKGAFDYDLKTDDANVAAHARLHVRAGSSQQLIFDGSAELDGRFSLHASAGNDVLTGGAKGDIFDLTNGGNDSAYGGKGGDSFLLGSTLDALDQIDGGNHSDFVQVFGLEGGADSLAFSSTTMTNIETLQLFGTGYSVFLHEDTIAAGEFLLVTVGDSVSFSAAAETDGNMSALGSNGNNSITGSGGADALTGNDGTDSLDGGASQDSLSGGAGTDTLTGGDDRDVITGGTEADTFRYNAVSNSTGVNDADVMSDLNADEDKFDTDVAVTAFAGTFDGGEVHPFSFETAMNTGSHAANNAWIVNATSGSLGGNSYLVIDVDGDGAYADNADLVINVTGYTGTIDAGDFI